MTYDDFFEHIDCDIQLHSPEDGTIVLECDKHGEMVILKRKRSYLCIYPHYWGRGHTPEEAKQAARDAGGRGTKWHIHKLPVEARRPYVDGIGCIGWVWDYEGTEEKPFPEGYTPGNLPIIKKGRDVRVKDLKEGQWQPEK